MLPFVECLHYIISTFYEASKGSYVVRDEDISFPAHFESHNTLDVKQIYDLLQDRITFYENLPKTGDKALD